MDDDGESDSGFGGCCGCLGFIAMVYVAILILQWLGLV